MIYIQLSETIGIYKIVEILSDNKMSKTYVKKQLFCVI